MEEEDPEQIVGKILWQTVRNVRVQGLATTDSETGVRLLPKRTDDPLYDYMQDTCEDQRSLCLLQIQSICPHGTSLHIPEDRLRAAMSSP